MAGSSSIDVEGNREIIQWAKDVYGTNQPFGSQAIRVGYLSHYLVVSEGEALLIDAGYGQNDSAYRLLDAVGIPPEKTTLFLTHLHIDHIGMAAKLAQEGVTLKMRRSRNADDLVDPAALLCLLGTSPGPAQQHALCQFDAAEAERSIGYPIEKLEPDAELRVGARRFRVLEFAGHAKGHGGLYEEETGIVFTGDQIIDQIVPAVSAWHLDRRDMGRFYESLAVVRSLHPRLMLPAHLRPVFGEEEIDEVIGHIERSFDKIANRVHHMLTVRREWISPTELARVFYGYYPGGFDGFSPEDQVFRLTKMLAYLELLYDSGKARRCIDDAGAVRYLAL